MPDFKAPKARKISGYLIEPVREGAHRDWEGHHATNPTVIRLAGDVRVFLGYRAGGDKDYYKLYEHDVWGSHMGLAVLDEEGRNVLCRFPWPIVTLRHSVRLPQTREEFDAFQRGPHKEDILILHDFRFWEDGDWLYLIYHEGTLTEVFDCIVRMRTRDFLKRVERSMELARRPAGDVLGAWEEIWWTRDVWTPCGVNGTNRIYASPTVKNDIVFIRLTDGSLRMLHRPCPDIAILDTGQDTYSRATTDGVTRFGSLQSCIRPGAFDNSHIGNNGVPIRVALGDTAAFMDVIHGVHNEQISNEAFQAWKLTYLPYLRLLDVETGECIYYSREPILDADEVWRDMVEEGAWVKTMPHHDAILFAGGQIEVKAGRTGLEDLFSFYTGVGDTAVARAEFRLRDLVPEGVIRDIQRRKRRGPLAVQAGPAGVFRFPEPLSGWTWSMENDPERREIQIHRSLALRDQVETGVRRVSGTPGSFDADGVFLDERFVVRCPGLGWVLVVRGVRWEEVQGQSWTQVGFGVLLLDEENPERVLYRSDEPIGPTSRVTGWTCGQDVDWPANGPKGLEDLIPERVCFEVRRTREAQPMPLLMTRWLREKSQAY